jgi:hypothetical protein
VFTVYVLSRRTPSTAETAAGTVWRFSSRRLAVTVTAARTPASLALRDAPDSLVGSWAAIGIVGRNATAMQHTDLKRMRLPSATAIFIQI